jgi:hypothetical protein
MEWRIDAWDARGGRAFATQRSADSDLAVPAAESWGPTVFIGPPSFRPEQIANIGIALGARRSGAFDARVPLDANLPEVAFGTADEVAEFVRRAYTFGGRDRGGDGGGGVAFEGGPGEPPLAGEGGSLAIENFADEWAERARHLVKNTKVDGDPVDELVTRQFPRDPPPAPPTALDSVQSGALQVLATLLDGLPLHGMHMPSFTRWREAASSLDAALSELALWDSWFLASEPARRLVSNYLMARGNHLLKQELPDEFDGVAYAQALLRWQPTRSDPDAAAQRFRETLLHSWHFADEQRLPSPTQFADRYEAMFSWPLPRYVRTRPEARSVGELLVSYVSAPALVAGRKPGAAHIVAFAAALLASRVEDRARENWRERAAFGWLARSVPRLIHRPEVEALVLEPQPRPVLAGLGR